MALTTREINNTGDPILDQTGAAITGFTVTFQLCNALGQAADTWDATTGERVVSVISSPTITAGEFSVSLWPNDRGSDTTYYRCVTSSSADNDRLISVASGVGALSWKTLMLLSAPVP